MLHALLLRLALLVSGAHAADWPDLSTPLPRTEEGRKDAVVLVSVEDYAELPDVHGATAAADTWLRWFVGVRGVPPSRVFKAYGAEATPAALRDLARQAAQSVQPGGTAWLVFIGRGDIDPGSGAPAVLTPLAGRTPAGVSEHGVTVASLVTALEANAQARAVALVDAPGCAAPSAGVQADVARQPRGHVLVACGAGGVSPAVAGIVGPAFPYLALGAVSGWADLDGIGNRDGRVGAVEVDEYVLGVLNLAVQGPRPTLIRLGADMDLGKAVRTPAPDVLALSLDAARGVPGAAGGAPVAVPAAPPAPREPRARRWPRPSGVRIDVSALGSRYAVAQQPVSDPPEAPAVLASWAAGGFRTGMRVAWERSWMPVAALRVGAEAHPIDTSNASICEQAGVSRCAVADGGWRDLGFADVVTDATAYGGAGVSKRVGGWVWVPRVWVGGSLRSIRVYEALQPRADGGVEVPVTVVDVPSLAFGAQLEALHRRTSVRFEIGDHLAAREGLWASEMALEVGHAISPRRRVVLGFERESRALTFGNGYADVLRGGQDFLRARAGLAFDL